MTIIPFRRVSYDDLRRRMTPKWKRIRAQAEAALTSPILQSTQARGAAIRQAALTRYSGDQYGSAWNAYVRILRLKQPGPVHITVESIYFFLAHRIYYREIAPHTAGEVLSQLKGAAQYHRAVWDADIDDERKTILHFFQKTQPSDPSKSRVANPITREAISFVVNKFGVATPGNRIRVGMFLLSYMAVLRGNDVLTICPADIDKDAEVLLLFFGKTSTVKNVTVKRILAHHGLPSLPSLIRRIRADRPPGVRDDTPLFPAVTSRGEVCYGTAWKKPVWLKFFRDSLRDYGSHLDPERNTPHGARAGYVTDARAEGVTRQRIREMGWTETSDVPFTTYDRRAWLLRRK
jgi:hypothetical protein